MITANYISIPFYTCLITKIYCLGCSNLSLVSHNSVLSLSQSFVCIPLLSTHLVHHHCTSKLTVGFAAGICSNLRDSVHMSFENSSLLDLVLDLHASKPHLY